MLDVEVYAIYRFHWELRGGTDMNTAAVYEVLYWIAIVAMAIILIAVNAAIFVLGIRFLKQKKWLLGGGAFVFSLFCFYLIIIMLQRTFFI